MRLHNETPSAMVQHAYSITYEDYVMELYAYLMAGTACGAVIVLAVVFLLLAIAERRQVQS